jgi:hypothetical protein
LSPLAVEVLHDMNPDGFSFLLPLVAVIAAIELYEL